MAMKPVFLVGYMGCGKSSLGRKLARRLGAEFVDTDTMVEEREGAEVADIFQYEGEERFRELEREALEGAITQADDLAGASAGEPRGCTTADVSATPGDGPVRACGIVVSTGGGLPVWRDNMERMNAAGMTIYLRRTPPQIASRLSPYGRQKRPRLRGLNDEQLLAFMTCNMAEREPFYSKARLTLDCSEISDAEALEQIVQMIRK